MTAILAIDTATNACSAAIWADGKVRASRFEPMIRGHAERLVPMIGEITEEAQCPVKSIDLIAVTVGPGAFTGMRVGLAAARGFALSAGAPCLGMTTLEVIAASTEAPGGVLVVIDSKRADVYVQLFGPNGSALSDPAALAPDDLVGLVQAHDVGGPLTLAGDAAERAQGVLIEADIETHVSDAVHPDAAILAALASRRWRPGDAVARPAPLYIRPPDAVVPKDGGRLRP